jgi:nucleoside-diphosphate-sugar epimerase/uncharacterized membrane protein
MRAPGAKPIVLITGAAGTVGSALGRVLMRDYHVVGLDRSECEAAHDSILFDLTSDSSVELALRKFRDRYGERIHSVVHLAAYFDFTGEGNPLYDEINVEGPRRLLRALQEFEVGQFIFSSTMLVHAPVEPGERVNESTPIGPRWIYPQSKVEAEQVIRSERGSIPVVLLRLAGLYDETTAVPTFAQQVSRIYERTAKSHLYSGDQNVGQSMVHRDDMIEAFRLTIARRDQLPDDVAILIGEEDAMGYGALQDRLGQLIHGDAEWKTLTVPKALAKGGAWIEETLEPVIPDALDRGEKPFIRPFMVEMADDHYALDISRAREYLGWEPQHSLDDTLPKIVESLKADPLGWYERNGVAPPPWLETADELVAEPELIRERFETAFRTEHARFLWAHFFNVAIGCWLLVAPFVLGYESTAMARSDVVAGIAVLILALLSLSWRLSPARWAVALIGVWLLMAPLLFWAPDSAAYLNGTLTGALVIGFAVLVRPAPGVSPVAALTGPTTPPGWTASPSSWFQRLPIIMLAFVGLFSSMYMTAYQLGYIEQIWDPFFTGTDGVTPGTAQVITSDISEAFPVPDAGLGAIVYMLEILLGVIGSQQRWRTMPWVVAAFGVLIVPLGVVSITFIVIQPILIGTWCALCLLAAAAMLLQIAYSSNELVATGQFLRRRKRAGQSLLRVFFTGDTDEIDGRREPDDFERPPQAIVRDMLTEGVTIPWNLVLCALIGVWLMFTRVTLGADAAMANADHLLGSLIVTVSVIAWAEVARAVRYLNLVFAFALLVAAFVFEPASTMATAASVICAVVLAAATLRRGPIKGRYGRWDACIV